MQVELELEREKWSRQQGRLVGMARQPGHSQLSPSARK